jgi:hypothetical protein
MQGWVALLGSLAIIALILTAFGVMLGVVKPGDAMKHIGIILAVVIALLPILAVLAAAWLAIPLWQRIALVAIAISLWQWRRQPPRKK